MAATITFLQTNGSATNLTTYTFTAENLGAASSDRKIIVAITGRSSDGAARSISTVTIGGVSASIAVQQSTNGNESGIAIASVPTGTSGDIVIVFSNTMGNCDIGTFSTTGVSSDTPTDSGASTANPGTYDLDVTAGGVAVAISSVDIESANMNTWAGLTERWDAQQSSSNNWSGASDAFATTQTNLTVSATRTSSSRPTFVVASFPPVSGPSNVKTYNTNTLANIKTINTNAIANVKTLNTNA